MKSKVLIAIVVILAGISLLVFMFTQGKKDEVEKGVTGPTPTPTTENTQNSNGVTETSEITVRTEDKSEKIIFHNVTGYTFTSYSEGNVTDRIVVSSNNVEVLQLGVNWTGYTQGSLPLIKVVLVKNSYFGNMYRATGGGISDGGYTLAATTKTTGKCTGNGDDTAAPCALSDQIYSKNKVFTYLPFCTDLDSVAKCDELMSNLEIRK